MDTHKMSRLLHLLLFSIMVHSFFFFSLSHCRLSQWIFYITNQWCFLSHIKFLREKVLLWNCFSFLLIHLQFNSIVSLASCWSIKVCHSFLRHELKKKKLLIFFFYIFYTITCNHGIDLRIFRVFSADAKNIFLTLAFVWVDLDCLFRRVFRESVSRCFD